VNKTVLCSFIVGKNTNFFRIHSASVFSGSLVCCIFATASDHVIPDLFIVPVLQLFQFLQDSLIVRISQKRLVGCQNMVQVGRLFSIRFRRPIW